MVPDPPLQRTNVCLKPGTDRRPGLSQAQPVVSLAGRHQTLGPVRPMAGADGESLETAGQAARCCNGSAPAPAALTLFERGAPDMIDE